MFSIEFVDGWKAYGDSGRERNEKGGVSLGFGPSYESFVFVSERCQVPRFIPPPLTHTPGTFLEFSSTDDGQIPQDLL